MADACDIRIGQFSVGQLSVLPYNVRGEGGPHDPRLVLPVELRLHGRPTDQQIAVTRLGVSIHLGDTTDARNQVGPTVYANESNVTFVSAEHETAYQTELRFRIDRDIVTKLEEHRHKTEQRDFVATLLIATAAACVYRTGDSEMGPFLVLAPFREVRPAYLTLRVAASLWVEQVLRGLGLDRYRVIEVALPSQGGQLPGDVVTHFDAARADYDQGRYRECIQKCRDVRHTIEQHLEAKKENPIAAVVTDRLGLPQDAPQRAFLDGLWKALSAMTSASHHVPYRPFRADARACLYMTALVVEYLEGLLTIQSGS